MPVTEVPAFSVGCRAIAVPAGQIVYVEGMVAESVAFRAGRTVGPCASGSVGCRHLSVHGGSPDRRPTTTGVE